MVVLLTVDQTLLVQPFTAYCQALINLGDASLRVGDNDGYLTISHIGNCAGSGRCDLDLSSRIDMEVFLCLPRIIEGWR